MARKTLCRHSFLKGACTAPRSDRAFPLPPTGPYDHALVHTFHPFQTSPSPQGTTRELLDSAAFHARPTAPAHPFFVEELDSEGEVERPARHAPAPGPRQAPRDSMDGYAAPPYFGGFTSRAGRSLELGTERGRDSVDLHVPRGTAMKEAAVVVERPHRPLAGPDHRAPAEELESPPMAAAVEEPHPPLTPIQLPGAERHAGGRTPRDPGARQSWRAHDPSSLLTPYELGQEEEGAGEAGEDEGKWAPGGERGRPMKGSAEAAWPHTELPDIATAPRKRSDDGDWRRQSFGRRDVLGSLGPWEEGEGRIQAWKWARRRQ